MSGWTALTFQFPVELEEPILLALQEAGTLGVCVEEGERGTRLATAYFAKGMDPRPLVRDLEALGESIRPRVAEVAAEPWSERQEEGRRPIRVGRRFLIVPRTETALATGHGAEPAFAAGTGPDTRSRNGPPDIGAGEAGERAVDPERAPFARGPAMATPGPGAPRGEIDAGRACDRSRIVLVVPPTRAFGTGEHETTRQCLELLETVSVAGRTVLDLGTGSGILAMAAARLGASRVAALDEDPEAIAIAEENLRLNRLSGSSGDGAGVELITGDPSCLRAAAFDLVLANLYTAALEGVASRLADIQPAGGTLIISGFSPLDAADLARVYEGAGYRRSGGSKSGEWAALVFVKERSST